MNTRFLVPTDGSDQGAQGVRYACSLAKACGGSLLGLHVIDVKLLEGPFLRDLSASLGTSPYMSYQSNIAGVLDERGRRILERFRQICAETEVACDAKLETGLVPRTIAEMGDLCDLTIMGRAGEHAGWLDGVLGSTTEAVLRRMRRPVLVTSVDEAKPGPCVIGYDGSHEARSALHAALEFPETFLTSLHVLGVDAAHCSGSMDEARAFLQRHDRSAHYETREGDASEVISAYARELEASLLVIGAYGQGRLVEMLLGSTTAQVMANTPCPVLLAH